MKLITEIPVFCPDDIRLAIADLDETYSAEWLAEDERKFFQALTNSRRQKEFVSARMLARKLGKKLGFDLQKFWVRKDKLGKPFGIIEDRHIYLSLAHTFQKILCGISEERDIGVDLEPADRFVNGRLGRRIYHPEESEEIRNMALIRLWTIKEALVKLYGGGLRTNLKDVYVQRQHGNKFLGRFDNGKSAIICSFQQEQHWIAVSYYQQ